MDEFDDSSDGSTGDLISSLISNASSAYSTTVLANANPLNTALITGGSVSTPGGSVLGSSATLGGSTGLLLILAIGAIAIITLRK